MVVAPTMDVVKKGLLIGFATKLGSDQVESWQEGNLVGIQHYQQQLLELLGHLKWCLPNQ
jgi:hypothetical protein